jgi:hypothetical protein
MYRNKHFLSKKGYSKIAKWFLNMAMYTDSPDECQGDDIVVTDSDSPVTVPAMRIWMREVRRKNKAWRSCQIASTGCFNLNKQTKSLKRLVKFINYQYLWKHLFKRVYEILHRCNFYSTVCLNISLSFKKNY